MPSDTSDSPSRRTGNASPRVAGRKAGYGFLPEMPCNPRRYRWTPSTREAMPGRNRLGSVLPLNAAQTGDAVQTKMASS